MLKSGDINIKAELPTSKFHRVRMENDACKQPTDRTDYPVFPVDATSKYTCIKAELDPSSTDQLDPLGLHLLVEDPGDPDAGVPPGRLILRDAGISDIPQWVQVTMSETDTKTSTGQLRPRCGTVTSGPSSNCMPPLIRVDQPEKVSRLFGVLELGSTRFLSLMPQVTTAKAQSRLSAEELANVDALPKDFAAPSDGEVPAVCTDSSKPAAEQQRCGVRAKVLTFRDTGTNENDSTDDKTYDAVKVGVNLPVPQSLTVDQYQMWSDYKGQFGDTVHWRAKDMRFHFVAKEAVGTSFQPIARMGEMSALIQEYHLPKTAKILDPPTDITRYRAQEQILISKPCAASGKPTGEKCSAAYNRGVAIPGEMGIDIYERQDLGKRSDGLRQRDEFRQIDGRVSKTLDLGARIVGIVIKEPGHDDLGIHRVETRVRDVPAAATGDSGPSFRVKAETMSIEPKNSCTEWTNCLKGEAAIEDLSADIDFKPGTGVSDPSARRVDAVLNIGGPLSQGLELKGYKDIAGTEKARVKVDAYLGVNPVNVEANFGIPVLGGAGFTLKSRLEGNFKIDADHFRLRHSTFHIDALSEGGTSRIGPMDVHATQLTGYAGAIVPIAAIVYIPTAGKPFDVTWPKCGAIGRIENLPHSEVEGKPSNHSTNVINVAGSVNVVLSPFDDQGILIQTILGPVLTALVRSAIPAFLCGSDLSAIKLMENGRPADPLGFATTGHAVPGITGNPPPRVDPPTTLPPPPASSDIFALSSDQAWCGTHAFDELTVNARLQVATAADSRRITSTDTTDDPALQRCPAGKERELQLIAKKITVNGSIDADGVSAGTSASQSHLNAGSSHTKKGGDGRWIENGTHFVNFPGAEYGDATDAPIVEAGDGHEHHTNLSLPHGGGVIRLSANEITVSGAVTARGVAGHSDAGACDATNKGISGGGSSGGGILIEALKKLNNTGTISVAGGDGGAGRVGGGGGGAGGSVKIYSPLVLGNTPVVSGGAFGDGTCNEPDGTKGGDGVLVPGGVPTSRPYTTDGTFWMRDSATSPLSVPVTTSAGGFKHTTILCGQRKTAAQIAAATGALEQRFDAPNATGAECGDKGGVKLGEFVRNAADGDIPQNKDAPVKMATNLVGMQDGYWGLWTRTSRDGSSVAVEKLPSLVDMVIGIDNTTPDAPTLTVPLELAATGGTFVTNSRTLPLTIEVGNANELSGIKTIECKNGSGGTYAACVSGANRWELPAGDGSKTVFVRLTDAAGNQVEKSITGVLDTTPSSLAVDIQVSGADGNNGWRTGTSMTIKIVHKELIGAEEPAGWRMVYQLDDGTVQQCDVNDTICDVSTTLLGKLVSGLHTITAWEIDRAGNAQPGGISFPRSSREIKIDLEKPVSAVVVGPDETDGSSGWYASKPWVGFSAFDGASGSGLVGPSGSTAGIHARFGYKASAAVMETFTFVDNPQPRQLAAGLHTVCWYAEDVAGLRETVGSTGTGTYAHCSSFKVDDAAPSATPKATLPSATPNGANGWYKQDVTVKVTPSDPTPGSGTAGTFVAIDEEPFRPYTSSFTLGEGEHVVRSYAVDTAGHESATAQQAYFVDESKPFVELRTIPGAPARNGWYRRNPSVVLRATDGDRNSGVGEMLVVRPGHGFVGYTVPFPLNAGRRPVTYQVTDRAGNVSLGDVVLSSDITPPGVKATSPQPTIWLQSKALPGLSVKLKLGDVASATAQIGFSNPSKAKLRWEVSDDLADRVRIVVVVYNHLGAAIRRLDGGVHTLGPGRTLFGYTEWDGKTEGSDVIDVGLYHYRVIAYDEAGNPAESGESKPMQVKLSLL